MAETLNLSTLANHFSDEAESWKLVERIRWPDGRPVCPHCGVIGHAYYLKPKNGPRRTRTGNLTYRRVWKCGACRQQFSVLVGTIFEDSRIPLSKWLLAVHMMCSNKNGVSAHELHRTLGIAYRSAWFMAHRIRYAMARPPLVDKLRGTVEAETRPTSAARRRASAGAGRSTRCRCSPWSSGTGRRSQALATVTGANVREVLREHVDTKAALMTDSLAVYQEPGREFASHETVNHGEGEYSRGNVHVNTAEGFFSQLKRSIDGTHHHVSERHLGRYLAEFDYRYSARKIKDGERTEDVIRRSAGKRLRYEEPVKEEGDAGPARP